MRVVIDRLSVVNEFCYTLGDSSVSRYIHVSLTVTDRVLVSFGINYSKTYKKLTQTVTITVNLIRIQILINL